MMADPVDIMLVTHCSEGRVDPETHDLIAFGRKLQKSGAGPMGIWLLGSHVAEAARNLADLSGLNVTAIQSNGLKDYLNDAFRAAIAQEIEAVRPVFVCTAHTSGGWEWAPGLAARMGAGCICGVDGLRQFRGRLCFQKDLYGGKVKGLYATDKRTTLITVQPGIFKFEPSHETPTAGVVTHKKVPAPLGRTRFLGRKQAETDTTHITSAPIIVAVGNGIGDRENMTLVHRLAQSLPRAAVAGTRIICDRGWLEYSRQVGVTGATVSPAPLPGLRHIRGISTRGMGMRGAKFVMAVNRDPDAPMFKEADICIVEDVVSFIPLLEDAARQIAKRNDPFPDDSKIN